MGNAKPWPEEGKLKPEEQEAVKRVIALQLMRPVFDDGRQKLDAYKGVLQRACHMTLEVFAQKMHEEMQRERRRLSNERIYIRQMVPRQGMIVASYSCRSFPGELALGYEEGEYLRERLVDDYIEFFFGSKHIQTSTKLRYNCN